jgi:hypothetical protein
VRCKSSPTTPNSTPGRKRAPVSLRVPAAPDPLSMPEISGTVTCPVTPGTPPDWEGLRCRPVSHSSRLTPGARGLWHHHMRSGPPPDRKGLRCRHVFHGSKPASQCRRVLVSPRATGPATRQGRALVSPRVPLLQTRLPMREGSGVATCRGLRGVPLHSQGA